MQVLIVICFITCIFCCNAVGQTSPIDKCSPALKATIKQCIKERNMVNIGVCFQISEEVYFDSLLTKLELKKIGFNRKSKIICAKTLSNNKLTELLALPYILHADLGMEQGREELLLPGHNLITSDVAYIHHHFPNLNGVGTVISIKENLIDSLDVDLQNRIVRNPNSSKLFSPHASSMATWAIGAGNAGPAGIGLALGAQAISTDFNGLLPEDELEYKQFGITVQNHSYGSDIDNSYGLHALAYDVSSFAQPHLLHVFSAGNNGLDTCPNGIYKNISGMANISGNFKMSKNSICVGAVNSKEELMPFSSHGPAYDGRIKPELVAYGQDGTSGAAAIVSGASLIIQQTYRDRFGTLPNSSMTKAILVSSAKDLYSPGPDFQSGFGCLNLKNAVHLTQFQFIQQTTLVKGEKKQVSLLIPDSMSLVRIAICWTDPPAQLQSPQALVNNIDMEILSPSNKIYFPWTLDSSPNRDSLLKEAIRKTDTLNNIELITLDFPEPGEYKILLSSDKLKSDLQSVSITAFWEKQDHFEWLFPFQGSLTEAAKDIPVHWHATYSDNKASIEWKPIEDSDWRPLTSNISLSKSYFTWQIPDTFCVAHLRMNYGTFHSISDSFLITKMPVLNTGFYCPDSTLFYWNDISNNAIYTIWALDNLYLEKVLSTADTSVVINSSLIRANRFALSVQSKTHNISSPTGLAPDPSTQGVGCYINNVSARRIDGTNYSEIKVFLGSLYSIQSIRFDKLNSGKWNSIAKTSPNSEIITIIDSHTIVGANYYRVIVEFSNTIIIISEIVEVWIPEQAGNLIVPNPISSGSALKIISEYAINDTPEFLLINLNSQEVHNLHLVDYISETTPINLPPGIYIWIIKSSTGKQLGMGKIAITP